LTALERRNAGARCGRRHPIVWGGTAPRPWRPRAAASACAAFRLWC